MILLQIERLQSKDLYKKYMAHKEAVEARYHRSDPCERKLRHGTASYAINNINPYGFNRSYCGKNGNLLCILLLLSLL